jgi:hypothetical protein
LGRRSFAVKCLHIRVMQKLMTLCAALLVLATSTASAGETREYPIGDLAISYDPAQWRFERLSAGDPLRAGPDVFHAMCIGCRGDRAFVVISVGEVTREESEAVFDPMWTRDRRHSTMTVGELTVGVTTIHSPCRNYVPSRKAARVTYKGKTYTFRSGIIVGCHGSTGVDSGRFEALLRGLHPRD